MLKYRLIRQRLFLALLLGLVLFLVVAPSLPARAASHVPQTSATRDAPQLDVCTFSFFGYSYDMCKAMAQAFQTGIQTIMAGAAAGMVGVVGEIALADGKYVWKTEDKQTYTNPTVVTYQQVNLTIADILLVLAILWASIRVAMGGWGNWLTYARLVDVLPRLFLGLLAAHFSLTFMGLLIQGNNALSHVFSSWGNLGGIQFTYLPQLQDGIKKSVLIDFVVIVYELLSLLLVLEMFLRLALINVLTIFSPLWMLCWIAPETQHIARRCTAAAIAVVFTQALQSLIVSFGANLLLSLALNISSVAEQFMTLCGAIAVLIVALWIPVLTQKITAPADGGASKVAGAIGAVVGLFA